MTSTASLCSPFPSPIKCVAIGGGTGLATLLRGLKRHVLEDGVYLPGQCIESLTAVVTVTDDGGSSGRLREEFQMLPPGDVRNCLVALSEDERLFARLFQYRFPGQGSVRGHSFGNLFLAALTGITGDFVEAIRLCSEVLAIKGKIVPSTTADVTLVAELDDGFIVRGESKISAAGGRIQSIALDPPDCAPLPETLTSIAEADLITLGPGSLFTSVIPNLLVSGVTTAIAASSALKVYICNLMTQPGETTDFSIADHVATLLDALSPATLDAVIINHGAISKAARARYRLEGARPLTGRSAIRRMSVPPSAARIATDKFLVFERHRIPVVTANLVEETEVIRHAPEKLARVVLDVYARRLPATQRKPGLRLVAR
ncbi:MAG: hypothetical protein CFK52_00190 [Chloracidobacterium sp. CP2_5A]|nr:MAG: hypothetical protein CFK52_00190 [Chloracidobacterium sp. CP2_5A]